MPPRITPKRTTKSQPSNSQPKQQPATTLPERTLLGQMAADSRDTLFSISKQWQKDAAKLIQETPLPARAPERKSLARIQWCVENILGVMDDYIRLQMALGRPADRAKLYASVDHLILVGMEKNPKTRIDALWKSRMHDWINFDDPKRQKTLLKEPLFVNLLRAIEAQEKSLPDLKKRAAQALENSISR